MGAGSRARGRCMQVVGRREEGVAVSGGGQEEAGKDRRAGRGQHCWPRGAAGSGRLQCWPVETREKEGRCRRGLYVEDGPARTSPDAPPYALMGLTSQQVAARPRSMRTEGGGGIIVCPSPSEVQTPVRPRGGSRPSERQSFV